MVVDQLSMPKSPSLKLAALRTGLIGPPRIGLTFGHSILIVRGTLGVDSPMSFGMYINMKILAPSPDFYRST